MNKCLIVVIVVVIIDVVVAVVLPISRRVLVLAGHVCRVEVLHCIRAVLNLLLDLTHLELGEHRIAVTDVDDLMITQIPRLHAQARAMTRVAINSDTMLARHSPEQ